MKQEYAVAYLNFLAGHRETVPQAGSYKRVNPDGTTSPYTAAQGRVIRERVDNLVKEIKS